MPRFARGHFKPKNPEKYAGLSTPMARSSWEFVFMKMLDENPSVLNWASESVKIPYRDPFTGKNTVYVPDFFVVYVDKNNQKHAELVEVKPANQTLLEKAGKNIHNRQQYVKNMAKWEAARAYCQQKNIKFRVVNETDMFHTGKRR